MARVHLIHWSAAEAAVCLERLRRMGHTATYQADQSGPALRTICAVPPEAIVIDLSRGPSSGRAVGVFFRQRKATRTVPVVFAGGTADAVAKARKVLPDALYAEWDRLEGVLEQALPEKRTDVVVPGTMDEYAGRPLWQKLGIRPSSRVGLVEAPAGFERKLEPLPEGAVVERDAGTADLVLLFTRTAKGLQRQMEKRRIAGRVWVIWPKKASGAGSDVKPEVIRQCARASGMTESKICAVDEDWSGMLFVVKTRE